MLKTRVKTRVKNVKTKVKKVLLTEGQKVKTRVKR